jgi:hypothetical protein
MTRLRNSAMTLGSAAGPPGHPQGPRAARPQVADRDRGRDRQHLGEGEVCQPSPPRRVASSKAQARQPLSRAAHQDAQLRDRQVAWGASAAVVASGKVSGSTTRPSWTRTGGTTPAARRCDRREGGWRRRRGPGGERRGDQLPAEHQRQGGTATSAEVRTARAPNRCRRWTTNRPADAMQEPGRGPWGRVQGHDRS